MTELPSKGGSYSRADDGSLIVVEQPKSTEPVAAQPASEAVASSAPADQPAPRRAIIKGGI